MRSTWLDRLQHAVTARPRPVLVAAALVTAAAAVLGSGIELRTSTRELVPPGDEVQARWEALQRDFHDPEPLIMVVEGGSLEARRTTVDTIARALAQRDDVAHVHYRLDVEWLAEHLLWLTPASDLRSTSAGLEHLLGSVPIEIGSLAELVELLAARLETSLAAGDPGAAGDTVAGAQRLADLATWLVRWLEDPETALAEAPATPRELVLERSAVADGEGYLSTAGGRLLLFVTRTDEDDGLRGEAAFVDWTRDLIRRVTDDLPAVTIGLTGPPAMTADEMAALRSDTRRTSLIAMIGVGLLAALAFHRRRYAILGLITLAMGVVWSLGAVRLELGYLNMITTALVPILIGIGIDYAVHPLSQFEVERRAGHSPPEAVVRAFRLTSAPVLVSALTTAGAFFCFLWMDFRGFSELGLVTGVGVLLCLGASLVVLPALLSWWPRTGRLERPAPPLDRLWGQRQAAALCSRPTAVLAVAVVLSVGAVAGAGRVDLRTGLVDLLPVDAESLRYLELIADDPEFSAWVNIITADDPRELANLAESAGGEASIARFESAAALMPTDRDASAAALQRLGGLLARIEVVERPWNPDGLAAALDRLQAALVDSADAAFLAGEGKTAGALETARVQTAAAAALLADAPPALRPRRAAGERALFDRLDTWRDHLDRAARTPAPTPAALPENLRARFSTRSGRSIGYLHPRGSIFDPDTLAEFNEASLRVDPEAVGFPVLFERMTHRITAGFGEALLLATLLIVAVLSLDLRHPGAVALALVPVLLGTLWLLGVMGAVGIDFNLANLIAIPLILGVGIDNGVHLVHRHRTERRQPIAGVLAQTGRAILIASLTTMIGFGSLTLASHRGMASLGILLLLGVGSCLVASLVVLPNLLTLLAEPGRREQS